MKVLLVVSGGIAAYKACTLVRLLGRAGHGVRVLMTPAATRFVTPLSFEALTGEPVAVELFEGRGAGIAHIDLARWPDLVVVAPATADLLARMTHGLADDLATSVLLAYRGPLLVAPAMNPGMWSHPATRENLARLVERGVRVVGPARGDTACGEEGLGRMVEPEEVAAACEALDAGGAGGPLAGRRVLVTAGATREHLDPARFLSNPSTGRMGMEVARAARAMGAEEVVVVRGAGALPVPPGCREVPVTSAREMHAAVMQELPAADLFVAAAAVADWTPREVAAEKQAKQEGPLSLELVRTPDILVDVVARRREGQVVVGFAAETGEVLVKAAAKLEKKGCDLLVANRIGAAGTGFAGEASEAALLRRGEAPPKGLERIDKAELASRILQAAAARLPAGNILTA